MAQVFSPTYGVIDENDPRYLAELAGAKQKGMTLYPTGASSPTTPPPPSGPAAAATQYSSPEEAYQKTGIAGYGKTFEQLLAERYKNDEGARLNSGYGGVNDQGQYLMGTPTGYQPTWQEMAQMASSWDADRKGFMDPWTQELIKKVGTWGELTRWVNKYHYNPSSFEGYAAANPNGLAYGMSSREADIAKLSWDETHKSQAQWDAEGGYQASINAALARHGLGPHPFAPATGNPATPPATPPVNNPAPTPQNPPQTGPLSSPINTGFQPTGPGYTYQNQNRNIGQNPLQPPAMTNNQPFNSYTSNFQLNPNQFKLPGQR